MNLIVWTSVVFFFFFHTVKTRGITMDASMCCTTREDAPSEGCQVKKIAATNKVQHAETPNYPSPFPKDKLCTWAFVSRRGMRVRATIRNFFLAAPNDQGCARQFIVIRSPITGLQMGPFCGKIGIPIIVSPDNFLIIQLADYANDHVSAEYQAGDHDNVFEYVGFRIEFEETEETPSIELRPQNWFSSKARYLNKPQIKNALAQIDPYKNEELNIEVPDLPDELLNVPPKKPKPATRRPPHITYRPGVYIPPHKSNINNEESASKSRELALEIVVGIVIGCVVVVALLVVAMVRLVQVYRKRARRRKEEVYCTDGMPWRENVEPTLHGENLAHRGKQNYLPYDHRNKCYVYPGTAAPKHPGSDAKHAPDAPRYLGTEHPRPISDKTSRPPSQHTSGPPSFPLLEQKQKRKKPDPEHPPSYFVCAPSYREEEEEEREAEMRREREEKARSRKRERQDAKPKRKKRDSELSGEEKVQRWLKKQAERDDAGKRRHDDDVTKKRQQRRRKTADNSASRGKSRDANGGKSAANERRARRAEGEKRSRDKRAAPNGSRDKRAESSRRRDKLNQNNEETRHKSPDKRNR